MQPISTQAQCVTAVSYFAIYILRGLYIAFSAEKWACILKSAIRYGLRVSGFAMPMVGLILPNLRNVNANTWDSHLGSFYHQWGETGIQGPRFGKLL